MTGPTLHHSTKLYERNPGRSNKRFMNGQDGLSSSFVESVAGFTAGIVSTLCLHPLDLIKTRLQGKSVLVVYTCNPLLLFLPFN